MSPSVIEVRIWGKRVGAVAFAPTLGCYAFEYEPRWIASATELAPLTMPLAQATQPFAFPALSKETYRGLPGLLADALPDEFGNALVDAWMANHGTSKNEITTLDRLAYMGKRGVGALEFHPARGSLRESAAAIEMKQLVETARQAVHGGFGDDREAQAALANIIRVGTSAGGARAKAVIAWNRKTNELRSGQFDTAPGFEHWLLKFDGVNQTEFGQSQDYGRIEYAYYLMATAAGVDMMPCELLHENGRSHFMTKRFDRAHNRKHHVLSLCGIAHVDYRLLATHAYEQYFQAISDLALGDAALEQGFRRMAFNVVGRNCDDHSKNVAFILKQHGPWELAPAFDLSFSYNSKGEWTFQHAMSVAGKFDGIRDPDLLSVADRYQVPHARDVLRDVCAVISEWDTFAVKAGVRATERARIATALSKTRVWGRIRPQPRRAIGPTSTAGRAPEPYRNRALS